MNSVLYLKRTTTSGLFSSECVPYSAWDKSAVTRYKALEAHLFQHVRTSTVHLTSSPIPSRKHNFQLIPDAEPIHVPIPLYMPDSRF
jgi:hypothetical protein